MNPRKLTTNKSQRAMARSTPDEIKARFDIMSDDYDTKYNEWITRFFKRMRIKHNDDNILIDIYVDEEIGRRTNEVVIMARVSKRKEEKKS